MRHIYLDHNATTPLSPTARGAMQAALEAWGNPSSVHTLGRRARHIVETARAQVAAFLNCENDELVFVSGGTEGDNLAVRGLALAAREARGPQALPPHVIVSPLEHPAVHGAVEELRGLGFAISHLPVSKQGSVRPEDLAALLRPETVLVSVALVNHEIGAIAPISALAALAQGHGAWFHTDAVAAAARVPVDVRALGVDAATVSAHKLYGPKGAGAVFVRRGLLPHPLVTGGHQEHERRGGTENTPALAGFGAACEETRAQIHEDMPRLAALRDRLEEALLAIPGARRHGPVENRAPGLCNVGFAGARGELVAIGLDLEGVCVSTGAACTSGSVEPSPVLLALGLPASQAREAVRFSLGRQTSADDVDEAAAAVARVVARVRAAA